MFDVPQQLNDSTIQRFSELACPPLIGPAVHVWLAALDEWSPALDECRLLLSADEHARAARFRDTRHRDRYQTARAILRFLAARYLSADPVMLRFTYGEHGKPELESSTAPLHFNLSHSGQYALFAFTRLAPVGVDIERVRLDMPRQMDIAERHFAPGEFDRLRQLPDAQRPGAFFRCWARKEAVIKARGDGIFGGLQNFEVSLDPGTPRILQQSRDRQGASPAWSMAEPPEVPGFASAVAVMAPGCHFWYGSIKTINAK